MRNRRLRRAGFLGARLAALALCLGTVVGSALAALPAYAAQGHMPAGGAGGPCGAFPGAHQLPGGDGVWPAAWSGGGLVVPACGPAPGTGRAGTPVHPYPDAPWTAGYQCVEFSERYLYDRYGVTMNAAANRDQVVADYAAGYPGLITVVKNGYLSVAVAGSVPAAVANSGESETATSTGAAANLRYAEWARHRQSSVEPAHGG